MESKPNFSKKLLQFLKHPSFLAFVYFSVLSIIMTYPLVVHMGSAAPGVSSDGSYFIWLVAWYQKALFHLHISPFFAPQLNYPQGWNLATTDITPAQVALALPGSLLFGPIWGYNFAMLLSFILSGWAMYLWVRHLTNDLWAGLVAGTIFAFLPFRMAHFIVGHLSLAGTQWFPFYFWGLFDLLRQEKFSWKPVLMAGIAAGLIGLTSPYYVYMTMLMTVVFLLGFLIFKGYQRLKSGAFWKSILVFGAIAAVLVGISMLPYFKLNAQQGLVSTRLENLNRYSASPTDFFIPSIRHFLWGTWVDRTFNPDIFHEATLYIGAVAFVLGVIAMIKRRKLHTPELVGIAILVAAVGFVLALGIQFHWMGKTVFLWPRSLQPLLHQKRMPTIYLPAYYLYKYLPLFSKMRVMMRFGLFTLVFTSLLAGLGAFLLTRTASAKIKRWVGVGLLVLVCIDFYPGVFKDFYPPQVRPVDRWLATQPDTGAVAQFPFDEESNQVQVYRTLIYQKPFLGGDFSSNPPEQYTRIRRLMNSFPSRESIALLRQLGVSYVVVNSGRYSNFYFVDRDLQSFGLPLRYKDSTQYVYGLGG